MSSKAGQRAQQKREAKRARRAAAVGLLTVGTGVPLGAAVIVAPAAEAATLNVTSSSPGVANGTSSSTYSYTVLAHSTPSLAADTQTTSGSVDLGIVAIDRTAHAAVGVYNLADLSGFTAGLNVTDPDVTGAGSIGG